ncbi:MULTISPECIES: hypothetical protein [Streptomyces]|nr:MULTISPECIES: hypothetical protein [Streptomyces]MCX4738696.1 hypothetical protein [Streptomyces antibioticus]MCX5169516.1 hypothetical protein [Streptomyces antibioticus]SMF58990.1 hypothetical protein SAMN02745830_04651 [Streptomyces sp. Amel2xC10]
MTTTAMTTGAPRQLPAGWMQRVAWTALVWCSLGMLVWVPFLYVAIRRGLPSDWGAFAAFALYECVTLPWAVITSEDDSDAFFGGAVIVTFLVASWLLLFAVFDAKTRPALAPAYGQPPYQQQPGYPYGR